MIRPLTFLIACCLGMIGAVPAPTAASAREQGDTWLERWRENNPTWRGLHLFAPRRADVPAFRRLVTEALAPMGVNVLVLEVGYAFKFASHPELSVGDLTAEDAREIAMLCREHGIRVIPLFNCLGHQSWKKKTGPLLRCHPEFDETPDVPKDNEGIYCRSWCPLHPEVNDIVFALLDELIDAFDADALHVGMDEVFLIASDQCPRCRGKDPAVLFARAVNDLHKHLVGEKKVEMLIWGDRLLDIKDMPYPKWQASANGTAPAVDMIPEDIIICDWHYQLLDDYPSVRFFQDKGFRVWPSTWDKPDAALALLNCSRKDATEKMLGMLVTGWSAGAGGKYLLGILVDKKDPSEFNVSARGVAVTLKKTMGALRGDE